MGKKEKYLINIIYIMTLLVISYALYLYYKTKEIDGIIILLCIILLIISLTIMLRSTLFNDTNCSTLQELKKESFLNAEIMIHSFHSSISCITIFAYLESDKNIYILIMIALISLFFVFITYKEIPEKLTKLYKFFMILNIIILNLIPALLISLIYYMYSIHTKIKELTTLNNSPSINITISEQIEKLNNNEHSTVFNIFVILGLLFLIYFISSILKPLIKKSLDKS